MADNVIKRIIQLVLDKASARKVQDDAKEAAGGVDSAWKQVATRIGGYLAAAFAIKKLEDFGRAAIQEAMDSQAAWVALKGTIDASGASFDALETKIRAAADAFQDSTIHDDDAFAETLARMTTLTGDAAASLNNMGLVANVAAQFFKGELEPAATLVAKVMNGNTTALHKMGISAKDADEALGILAQRSMGAATREAGTFSGQLKQLDEMWKDLLKETGNAIIQSDGASERFQFMRNVIQSLTKWVHENRQAISDWVTKGIRFAIDAADVFIRAVWGMGNAITGGILVPLGAAAEVLAFFVRALQGVANASAILDLALGNTEAYLKDSESAKKLKEQADALDEWGAKAIALGSDKVKNGIDILSKPLFSSDDFKGPSKVTPLEVNKPMTGKNMVSEDMKKIQDALKQFREDTKAAENMARILGDRFDATGAEIDRTTKILNFLAAHGIDPASVGLGDLNGRLVDLVTVIKPTEDGVKSLAKSLKSDAAVGAIAASASLRDLQNQQQATLATMNMLIDQGVSPQSKEVQALQDHYDSLTDSLALLGRSNALDQLKKQQSDVLSTIKTLIDQGLSPQAAIVTELTDRYNQLTDSIDHATKIQDLAEIYKALGDEMRSNVFMATVDTVTELDKLQQKQQALQKAMQSMLAKGIDPQSAALRDLAAQYRDVTDAIKEQTISMEAQSAAADLLADILGTAMKGGLHDAAVQKAKANAIESVEMLARAAVFGLFGNYPAATKSLALAGQFAATSAAWAGIAAATGGGGGSSSAGSVGAGGDLSSSRESSSASASNAEQPKPDVSIYFVGPGFNALNPEVQRVVWGAQKNAEERFGPNARVSTGPAR